MANPAIAAVSELAKDGDWLSIDEAMALTKRSRRKIGRLVESGAVHRRRDSRGRWEYERESLERVLQRPDETDAADLMDVARGLLNTMESPMRLYVEHLKLELAAMRARCAELESLQTQLITAREEALSQAFDREVLALKTEGEENRKTLALNQGAALVGAVTAEMRASRFLGSFTLEQLEMFASLGGALLTPEQLAELNAFKQQRAATAEQAAKDASAVHAEGEAVKGGDS